MYTYVLKLPKIPTKTKYKSIVVKAPGEYEIKNPSQNLKKNIFKRSGKFLKNVGFPQKPSY
ncbi:hypothetical protein LEP1GSC123_2652 [Leptospira borgpetersenii str. 200701203]|uniref:Uncharacterized protein n=2 Tax=Leptospira borgpetersenii TaxID=174 RepID=M3HQ05_LEPBO|nr:hypothetical protein LEP1GSC123_2652 [Leptospira borgpetersenii str. 200701203]